MRHRSSLWGPALLVLYYAAVVRAAVHAHARTCHARPAGEAAVSIPHANDLALHAGRLVVAQRVVGAHAAARRCARCAVFGGPRHGSDVRAGGRHRRQSGELRCSHLCVSSCPSTAGCWNGLFRRVHCAHCLLAWAADIKTGKARQHCSWPTCTPRLPFEQPQHSRCLQVTTPGNRIAAAHLYAEGIKLKELAARHRPDLDVQVPLQLVLDRDCSCDSDSNDLQTPTLTATQTHISCKLDANRGKSLDHACRGRSAQHARPAFRVSVQSSHLRVASMMTAGHKLPPLLHAGGLGERDGRRQYGPHPPVHRQRIRQRQQRGRGHHAQGSAARRQGGVAQRPLRQHARQPRFVSAPWRCCWHWNISNCCRRAPRRRCPTRTLTVLSAAHVWSRGVQSSSCPAAAIRMRLERPRAACFNCPTRTVLTTRSGHCRCAGWHSCMRALDRAAGFVGGEAELRPATRMHREEHAQRRLPLAQSKQQCRAPAGATAAQMPTLTSCCRRRTGLRLLLRRAAGAGLEPQTIESCLQSCCRRIGLRILLRRAAGAGADYHCGCQRAHPGAAGATA